MTDRAISPSEASTAINTSQGKGTFVRVPEGHSIYVYRPEDEEPCGEDPHDGRSAD